MVKPLVAEVSEPILVPPTVFHMLWRQELGGGVICGQNVV
jgi:hypothetical protein